ncbi:hypothetical protein LTR08_007222 [Meristemomyces frigidus]|nr:hypothetical protein LTR08_007222 [Meristemomyces frigidus]
MDTIAGYSSLREEYNSLARATQQILNHHQEESARHWRLRGRFVALAQNSSDAHRHWSTGEQHAKLAETHSRLNLIFANAQHEFGLLGSQYDALRSQLSRKGFGPPNQPMSLPFQPPGKAAKHLCRSDSAISVSSFNTSSSSFKSASSHFTTSASGEVHYTPAMSRSSAQRLKNKASKASKRSAGLDDPFNMPPNTDPSNRRGMYVEALQPEQSAHLERNGLVTVRRPSMSMSAGKRYRLCSSWLEGICPVIGCPWAHKEPVNWPNDQWHFVPATVKGSKTVSTASTASREENEDQEAETGEIKIYCERLPSIREVSGEYSAPPIDGLVRERSLGPVEEEPILSAADALLRSMSVGYSSTDSRDQALC